MNFDKAFGLVVNAEGGYSNDPKDNGAETICGISRKFNPTWTGWKYIDIYKARGCDNKTISDLCSNPNGEVFPLIKSFYRGAFWNHLQCESLPELLKYPLFSCAVNCGISQAVKFVQRAVDTTDDGIIGINTLSKINSYPATITDLLDKFYTQWSAYYDLILGIHPEYKEFINGWKNRISKVKAMNN